jgi:hypothetical protein
MATFTNAPELAKALALRGVSLKARGKKLVCLPKGAAGDLLPEVARFKSELLALLARDDVAPAHRWQSATGDTSATDATAPDVAASATTGSAAAIAPDDPRVKAVLSGQTVVANKDADGDLIAWAEAGGLAVGIMRQSQWGNARWASQWANPYRMKRANNGDDRDAVCDKFAAKLEKSPELLAQLPELKGRVLVCCCYPQRCHGDELARRANELPDVAASATPDSAAAIAPGDGAPDVAALARAVAGAQRGAFISPTPDLMARWRALDQYIGVKLTSRHIGAAARLVAQHPQLDNNELLDLFAAGLQPDEGAGKPVWIEPEQLADETEATAQAHSKDARRLKRERLTIERDKQQVATENEETN